MKYDLNAISSLRKNRDKIAYVINARLQIKVKIRQTPTSCLK